MALNSYIQELKEKRWLELLVELKLNVRFVAFHEELLTIEATQARVVADTEENELITVVPDSGAVRLRQESYRDICERELTAELDQNDICDLDAHSIARLFVEADHNWAEIVAYDPTFDV